MIKELHEKLINKTTTSEELTKESLEKAHNIQEKTNAFVTIVDDAYPKEVSDSLISGIPCGIKDNCSTKGILTTGSSNTLKDYVPFFDATCVENLKKNGAVIISKTTMDEMGMGGTGKTAHTGYIHNPWDLERMCGGSSSGSVASVAAGVYPYALGTDTGDSIRKPASYCGVVGYKPTYGMISRYGVFPFASSLDTVGCITRSVEDAAIVVDAMKGKDKKDMTSWDSSNINLYNNLKKETNKKMFYIKEMCEIEYYENPTEELKEHLKTFKEQIENYKKLGYEIDSISFDRKLLNALPSIYVIISCAESTSNMANLTGIVFGPRGEGDNPTSMVKDHRSKGFNSMIKRRFVIGSYILQSENQDRYFFNAKRVRRLICNRMNELFKTYDAMLSPVGQGPAPYLDDSKNNPSKGTDVLENLLQIGNFGGYPSITIPCGFENNLPVGINITGKVKDDQTVLNIAYTLESSMNYKDQTVKEVK